MEIPDIKKQLTIDQVLAYYNLRPDRNQRLHCPFHDDKTPSLQVYPKTSTVYCFSGNCPLHGKALDVIDFVWHKEGCSKHEAIQKCKELIGSLPAYPSSTPGEQTASATAYDTLLRQFRANLKKSPQAQAYLEKRVLSPGPGDGL